ncbi:prepilin-type N-terminal cleavage/methylation domain-containing protein [Viridibacillus arvi]|nr:prepilin-type N-terminal cleavage/methylation domain-containing protein [Viridibacillus sp. JNUCC-6]
MNKIKKMIKNERGMTLIELLAVIVIIAIIAVIAIPAIGNIINNTRDKAIITDATQIISGAKIAVQDGACTTTCTNAQLTPFVDANLESTDSVTITTNATTGAVVYSINYHKFKDIKDTTKYAEAKDGATLAQLNGMLDNKSTK